MVTAALFGLLAAGGGAGVLVAGSGLRRVAAVGAGPSGDATGVVARATAALRRPRDDRRWVRGAVACGVGLLALVVTRWPMALPLGALAVLGLRGLGGGPAGPVIARLEAIAGWTEMLRDTLAGAAGLTQAIVATAAIAPAAVREPVAVLAARLAAGVPLERALRDLALDLDDPAGDVVVASLLLAATERAQRLGDLLGALASATREEVAMRQAVEASRASARSAVRTVTGCSFALVVLMAVFARSYLAPYHSLGGQVVLGVVGVIFGLGLWMMSAMVRPEPVPRLFAPAQP